MSTERYETRWVFEDALDGALFVVASDRRLPVREHYETALWFASEMRPEAKRLSVHPVPRAQVLAWIGSNQGLAL